MSQENQSSLRFSLEESLWFRKGQEVEELVSISLDPDITIQENDQYVTIRGSLQLTGEYKSYEAGDASEDGNITNQKFVEKVDEREEGICEFAHRFPVDITIPNNRIQSIYDIDVLVETFDYSIPERSCLKLSAELTISGLYGSQQQEEMPKIEVQHRTDTDTSDDETVQMENQKRFEDTLLFEAEARKQHDDETIQMENQKRFEDTLLFEAEARKQHEEESVEILPKFPTFSYQPQEESQNEPEHSWNFQAQRSEEYPPVEFEKNVVVEEPHVDVYVEEDASLLEESSSSSEEAPKKKEKKKKAPKKKNMSLTEFFDRKEENAEQAKLKMCIVQKGETIDSLADRYDITVQNLLRVNNMELNQDVSEGQVLYVPIALAKK